jgi:formylglycine-generating enzyme required for sulfatase activity
MTGGRLALAAAALAALAGGALAALAGGMLTLRPAPPSPALAALGSEAACAAYGGLPPAWGRDPHAGMLRLAGGSVTLGADDGYAEERPRRQARVDAFWIDRTEVTNAQFAAFVQATGHVTEAERRGRGVVFAAPPQGAGEVAYGSWWHEVAGADWRHPDGPGSSIAGRANQPVVQVTRADAQAYAHWLGRSLPTEAQWEYAARAGGQPERVERGPRDAQGRPRANFWQGLFPYLDTDEDGHAGRAPVGCYAANGYGLHDMIGNVWEWTADPWQGGYQPHGTGAPVAARGAVQGDGLIKGGSFLCATDFCVRYRASARHPQDLGLSTVHVGFRTVAADGG